MNLLLLALLIPLQTYAANNESPQLPQGTQNEQDQKARSASDAQLQQAAATLLHSPNHATGPIKEDFARIGEDAVHVMQWHMPPQLNEAYEQQLAHFEDQMARIQENIRRLQHHSDDFYRGNRGTPDENEAARVVRNRATTVYEDVRKDAAKLEEQRKKIHNRTNVQRGALLGVSSALAWWVQKINPIKVYRSSYELHRTRVTGVEMVAAASAAGSTFKSLFGPIATIVVIGYLWYQFKNYIVEPYKRQHQDDVVKFKTKLTKHKDETAKQIEEINAEMGKTRGNMEKAMNAIRGELHQAVDGIRVHVKEQEKHVDQQLHQMQETHTQHLKTVREDTQAFKQAIAQTQAKTAEAQAKTLADIEERNRLLREQIEKENKELQAQLVNDQAEFTTIVNEFTTGLKQSHDHLREDVEKMAETTQKVKEKCDQAVIKLGAAFVTMEKIKATTVEELALLRKDPKALLALQQKAKNSQAPKAGVKLVVSPRGSERKE